MVNLIGYKTNINWRFLQSHLAGIDDKWIYLPAKKVEVKQYLGNVYNLSTEQASYITNGVTVHNCSRDHWSTVVASLNEAMRFARSDGINHPEVQRRIELASDELNIMRS